MFFIYSTPGTSKAVVYIEMTYTLRWMIRNVQKNCRMPQFDEKLMLSHETFIENKTLRANMTLLRAVLNHRDKKLRSRDWLKIKRPTQPHLFWSRECLEVVIKLFTTPM